MALLKSCYFHHDYNASNDAKVLFLRQQLGMEGYGIYWFILEQLAQAGGSLPLKIIPVLAMQSQTQETKVRAVIDGYELFNVSADKFFSIRLNGHLEIRKQLSDFGKKGVQIREARREASRGASSNPLSNKEINKEIKKGDFFSADNRFVVFPDGSQQELGEVQTLELKNGSLLPKQVVKGYSY